VVSEDIASNILVGVLNCTDEAVQRALALDKSPVPSKSAMQYFLIWLQRDTMGKGFLEGDEAFIWPDTATDECEEYVSLRPAQADTDVFTDFLNGKMLDLYHATIGRRTRVTFSLNWIL
jgi:hypothetical protein